MGLPAQQNLAIYKGDTFVFQFQLLTPESEVVDLTGVEVKAQIRATEDSGSVVAEFDASHDDDGGTVTLALTPLQTTAIVANGKWDVQLTFPDTTVKTYLRGDVVLTKEVTRV